MPILEFPVTKNPREGETHQQPENLTLASFSFFFFFEIAKSRLGFNLILHFPQNYFKKKVCDFFSSRRVTRVILYCCQIFSDYIYRLLIHCYCCLLTSNKKIKIKVNDILILFLKWSETVVLPPRWPAEYWILPKLNKINSIKHKSCSSIYFYLCSGYY